jgi:hypothetical protein
LAKRNDRELQRPLSADVSRQSYHVIARRPDSRIADFRAAPQQQVSLQQARRENPTKGSCRLKCETAFPGSGGSSKALAEKPETGRYRLVCLIRSDSNLNIFGEIFRVPPELKLEYVVATINVKEQKLKLFLDKTQVDEFSYKLR